jgi:ribonucleoside-diphosphate reductase alpha chain
MNKKSYFRSNFSEDIFNYKYKHEGAEDWAELSKTLIEDVCRDNLSREEKDELIEMHTNMEFIAGGRYLYYAGRMNKFFNNCYLLKSLEDTREDWANTSWKAISALMTGGGIGNNYDVYRPKGALIKRTGGKASGPISMMKILNENGREVMQGGSRRSAIYASLNWLHGDAGEFLHCKDWASMPVSGAYDLEGNQLTVADLKEKDFNYPAPLDMTNISLNYDNKFLEEIYGKSFDELLEIYEKGGKNAIFELEIIKIPITFLENCRQALKTGEPGFSFNFFEKVFEILRNACTEVTSEDDSDVCNLASVNMSRISDKGRMARVVYLVGKFLLCGTLVAELPYEKVYEIREKNRRLGMGIMGVHEWLLQRGYKYEVTPELHEWLAIYKEFSESGADELAEILNINKPVAYRAIAPTGTIGIMAGTTTGIEPLFAVAYKRRYLKGQKEWHYQYVIDGTAKALIKEYGVNPYEIETALSLASDYERRIKFQADIQDYVDMSISSTINLPEWGSALNNDTRVNDFARVLAKYAVRLRGFTCYPDGSRGGQPLTIVDYHEAKDKAGQEFKEEFMDICSLTSSGTCGM